MNTSEQAQNKGRIHPPAQESEQGKILTVAKNVINIYAKPDVSSEVTTQAILGSRLAGQERNGNFVRVICEDRYTGWACAKHLIAEEITGTEPAVSDTGCPVVTELFADVYSAAAPDSELMSRLVISTRLRMVQSAPVAELAEFVQINLPEENTGWIRRNCFARPSAVTDVSSWDKNAQQREVLIKMLGERVAATAKRFIGVPYLWGGCTPFGIDCSGLTQLCYKIEGVRLLRDTYLQSGDRRFVQVEQGISFNTAHFLPGDLLIFGTENNRGTGDYNMHIGIALGDGRFIHSSGRERNFGVYIDSCSEPFYIERYMKGLRLSASAELSISNA